MTSENHLPSPFSLSRLLSPVSCLTSPVSRLLSPVSCFVSSVTCLLSHVCCLTSPVSRLQTVSRLPSHISRLSSHASCLISPVSRILSHVVGPGIRCVRVMTHEAHDQCWALVSYFVPLARTLKSGAQRAGAKVKKMRGSRGAKKKSKFRNLRSIFCIKSKFNENVIT